MSKTNTLEEILIDVFDLDILDLKDKMVLEDACNQINTLLQEANEKTLLNMHKFLLKRGLASADVDIAFSDYLDKSKLQANIKEDSDV